MTENILEMRGITKEFPGVKALDNVNFAVKKGSIHALVGENGAGKSTLMNVLSGWYPYGSYSGDIVYEGEVCKFSKIKDSEEKGIVIIHQELALVPYMTIGENMFLGNEQGKKYAINWDKTHAEATKYLKIVGLTESSKTLIKDIGVGKQQMVEIAKALAKNARLMILDEPTSSLNEEDSQALLDLLLEFKKQGMTSIIISHKINEVSYVADDITILATARRSKRSTRERTTSARTASSAAWSAERWTTASPSATTSRSAMSRSRSSTGTSITRSTRKRRSSTTSPSPCAGARSLASRA